MFTASLLPHHTEVPFQQRQNYFKASQLVMYQCLYKYIFNSENKMKSSLTNRDSKTISNSYLNIL